MPSGSEGGRLARLPIKFAFSHNLTADKGDGNGYGPRIGELYLVKLPE
jgi:hypothetical protein